MWWFLIKSILPILISFISLGISIFTASKNFREERFDLDFDLIKWFGSSNREDAPDHLWLTITNNSKLPCSRTVFYQAIVEAGLRRHLFFPPESGITAGYITPWGYLQPDALLHDELLRARHRQAALQKGWKKGVDSTGRSWSVGA